MSKLVPYYRVSTSARVKAASASKPSSSVLPSFARQGQHEITASFQEIETGKRADRPQLAKALAYAKRTKAVLVIAKLDRLARNVHFLSGLMEAGVEFVCCDMPSANRLTLHILAAVAEDEARRISERTKAALAAYKARGGKLGTIANLTREAGRRGAADQSRVVSRQKGYHSDSDWGPPLPVSILVGPTALHSVLGAVGSTRRCAMPMSQVVPSRLDILPPDRRQLHFPTATITIPHRRVPLFRLLSRPVMS